MSGHDQAEQQRRRNAARHDAQRPLAGDEVAVNQLDRSAMGMAGRRFEELTGQEDVLGAAWGEFRWMNVHEL